MFKVIIKPLTTTMTIPRMKFGKIVAKPIQETTKLRYLGLFSVIHTTLIIITLIIKVKCCIYTGITVLKF